MEWLGVPAMIMDPIVPIVVAADALVEKEEEEEGGT
jgi:hypothetical protein